MIVFENTEQWNLEEMAQTFEKKGFVLGGKLLSDDAVDLLNKKIEQYLAEQSEKRTNDVAMMGTDKNSVILQMCNVWYGVDEIADIFRSSEFDAVLKALFGDDTYRVYHDQLQFKPPRIGGVNCWHQDVEFWPFQEPYTEVTAWLALDDADESNGCMRMVPGSHQWGKATDYLRALTQYLPLEEAYEGNKIEVESCIVPKGHVHFHHNLAWHGSGPNFSEKPRRALAFHIVKGKFFHEPKYGYKLDLDLYEEIKGDHFPVIGTPFASWATMLEKAESDQ
jgi:phytanoyl-CoA hydroxylase